MKLDDKNRYTQDDKCEHKTKYDTRNRIPNSDEFDEGTNYLNDITITDKRHGISLISSQC